MKSYRPYAPDPSFLLPPSPSEWLPKGHLAYFVLDLVADLDAVPMFFATMRARKSSVPPLVRAARLPPQRSRCRRPPWRRRAAEQTSAIATAPPAG